MTKHVRIARIALISLVAAIALAACGGAPKAAEAPAPAPDGRSLYERLGGKDAITAVVKDFVDRVAKDNRINAQFANADIPKLEANLVDQICQATGGPCEYKGKDMKAAHVGMKITEADFVATVEDLEASLDHFKVPEREQQELLGALAAMRGDIVTVK